MLNEPLYMWAETYIMQASSGRRKAVSTDVKLLDEILTIPVCRTGIARAFIFLQEYWEKLEFNCARTANLCSLHVFKAGTRGARVHSVHLAHLRILHHLSGKYAPRISNGSLALIRPQYDDPHNASGGHFVCFARKKVQASLLLHLTENEAFYRRLGPPDAQASLHRHD